MERIPHPSQNFAYLELRASSVPEWLALRAEALTEGPYNATGATESDLSDPDRVLTLEEVKKALGASEGEVVATATPTFRKVGE